MRIEADWGPAPNGWRWVNLPAIALIWGYRMTLSQLIGRQCRFVPSCSVYALCAYRSYNPFTASYLVFRRVLRCRPGGGGGYDPVAMRESDEDRVG